MPSRHQTLTGTIPGSTQGVVISGDVVETVRRFKQTKMWSTEAGGQLFGRVSAELIEVTVATEPHSQDARSRHSFRSSPKIAQRRIDEHFERGFLYLGEWHTHPERYPSPSGDDLRAMQTLLGNSELSTNALLLLIVGTASGHKGMTLRIFTSQGARVIMLE